MCPKTEWDLVFDVLPTPVKEIDQEMSRKEGIYCLLFSTRCIGNIRYPRSFVSDQVLFKWKISYSEWLSRNKPFKIDVNLLDDGGARCRGLVVVNARTRPASAPDHLELEFIYDKGRWSLINTPYSLGE